MFRSTCQRVELSSLRVGFFWLHAKLSHIQSELAVDSLNFARGQCGKCMTDSVTNDRQIRARHNQIQSHSHSKCENITVLCAQLEHNENINTSHHITVFITSSHHITVTTPHAISNPRIDHTISQSSLPLLHTLICLSFLKFLSFLLSPLLIISFSSASFSPPTSHHVTTWKRTNWRRGLSH